jgi:hypothetical protein
MTRHDLMLLSGALLLSLSALAGCAPKIGDACSVSTDCSATGGRLCDSTQPGGYCTLFNCEPGSCPSEAICVAFKAHPSQAAACADPQGSARLERTFCMAKCSKNSDCRAGYACIDMNVRNNPFGAVVVEHGADKGKVDGRVCAVPLSGAPVSADADTAVCTGQDDGGYGSFEAGPDAEAGRDAAPDSAADASVDSGEAGVDSGEAGVDSGEAGVDSSTDAAQGDASDATAD